MPPHENSAIGKRFLLSIGLTALILVAEVAGGMYTAAWRCFRTQPMFLWMYLPWR